MLFNLKAEFQLRNFFNLAVKRAKGRKPYLSSNPRFHQCIGQFLAHQDLLVYNFRNLPLFCIAVAEGWNDDSYMPSLTMGDGGQVIFSSFSASLKKEHIFLAVQGSPHCNGERNYLTGVHLYIFM